MTEKYKYRHDIDVLRAAAVTLVILGHYFPTIAPGGYIGVDIFFVISGFLITGILFSSNYALKKSLIKFYARRCRRLLPTIIMTFVIAILIAKIYYFEDELSDFQSQLKGATFFYMNILMYTTSGYFDPENSARPLMHFWSLAIEEQFYLLWPFLIIPFRKRLVFLKGMLLLITILGFSYALFLSNSDPISSYYSLGSRFFALTLGALAFFYTHKTAKFPTYALTISVLALFAYAMFAVNYNSVYPGYLSIFPTLITAFLMALKVEQPSSSIGSAVMTSISYIGKISFPLYLYHWLFLSNFIIISGMFPTFINLLGLIFLTVSSSMFTYHLIENRVRKISSKKIALPLVTILCIVFGTSIVAQEPSNSPQNGFQICKTLLPEWSEFNDNRCYTPNPGFEKFILIGDSHAGHLRSGMEQLGLGPIAIFPASCAAPFLYLSTGVTDPKIIKIRQNNYLLINKAFEYALDSKSADTIILAHNPNCSRNSAFDMLYEKDVGVKKPNPNYLDALERSISRTFKILSQYNKQIIVVLDNPSLPYDPKKCLRRIGLADLDHDPCFYPLEKHQNSPSVRPYNKLVEQYASKFDNIEVFDAASALCNAENCNLLVENKLVWRDRSHLSKTGSFLAVRELMKMFDANK